MPRDVGSAWPQTAGYLAITFGVIVAAGSFLQPGDASQAMQLPAFAFAVGLALAAAGVGLVAGMAWGRGLFIVIMPLAAVALASNHPALLWSQDIPYTRLLILPYAVSVFFLSRPAAQRTLARTNYGWIARGGIAVLCTAVVFGAFYGWLSSQGSAGGGPRLFGFDHLRGGSASTGAAQRFLHGLVQANAFVAKKAVAITLLGHAVAGLVAVSIPPRAKTLVPQESARPGVGLALLWILACAGGMIAASLAGDLARRALFDPGERPGTLFLVVANVASGAVLGASQAAIPWIRSGTGPVRWIIATTIGWALGSTAAAVVFTKLEADFWELSVRTAFAIATYGALLGAAQAVVLRGSAQARWFWALAMPIAGVAAWALFVSLTDRPPLEGLTREEAELAFAGMRRLALVAAGLRGAASALFTLPLFWLLAQAAQDTASTPRKEGAVTGKRDVFQLIGFMIFYRLIQLAAPLFLMGLLIWVVNQKHFELTKEGPFILVGLGAWAIWELTRLIKWKGFQVVITDSDITVGKRTVDWADIKSARVQTAIKYDTWIELTPTEGEPLCIPAAIGQKSLLLTLVEKHHPALIKG